MTKNQESTREDVEQLSHHELGEPPFYRVILHNDDFTTQEFVIMILEVVFGKDTAEATKIMLHVHQQGSGIAGVYTHEIGETKIAVVRKMARKYQYPLKCSLEQVS